MCVFSKKRQVRSQELLQTKKSYVYSESQFPFRFYSSSNYGNKVPWVLVRGVLRFFNQFTLVCYIKSNFEGKLLPLSVTMIIKEYIGLNYCEQSKKKDKNRMLERWRIDQQLRACVGYSCKGPRFGSQHPHGSSQPSLAPIPGDMMPSSVL